MGPGFRQAFPLSQENRQENFSRKSAKMVLAVDLLNPSAASEARSTSSRPSSPPLNPSSWTSSAPAASPSPPSSLTPRPSSSARDAPPSSASPPVVRLG